MKKLIILVVIGLVLLVAAGCSQGPGSLYSGAVTPASTRPAVAPATTAPPNSGVSFSSDQQLQAYHSAATSSPSERMVVRTGNIELVVSDVSAALDNITKIAADFGGYVVTAQKSKDGERTLGNISIRVLAENYDKAIASLRSLALDVINETSSSQDVTQEYTDLSSQVKNLEATEAQLLKIMQSAEKTEDILSIQRELTSVRGQIEQSKGRMLYLERTSATSLIQIKLNETLLDLKFSASKVRADIGETIFFTAEISGGFAPYNYQWDFGDGAINTERSPSHSYKDPGIYSVSFKVTDDKGYANTSVRSDYITIVGSWSPGNVARSAWAGFAGFGRVFINVVIWLAVFAPLWIIIGGIVWWTVYRRKRSRS